MENQSIASWKSREEYFKGRGQLYYKDYQSTVRWGQRGFLHLVPWRSYLALDKSNFTGGRKPNCNSLKKDWEVKKWKQF